MTWIRRVGLAIALVVGAVLVFLAYQAITGWMARTDYKAERDVALVARDSARTVALRTSTALEDAVAAVAARDATIDSMARRGAALEASTAHLRRSAETSIDSARHADDQARDYFYERGIAQLRAALDSAAGRRRADSTMILELERQVATLRAAAPRVLVGLSLLNTSGAQLAAVVARSEQRCRILLAPCPSRKAIAIGGLVLGAIGGAAVVH